MRGKVDMDEDEKGKLFVGGLSWETTQEALQRYFSRYGEVVDCVVMKNTESGRSRGFGFVTFADPANVGVVLQNGPHVLDGRTIDPKPCNPRTLSKPKRNNGYPKVFLGGLPSNVTETDLRQFFMRYGKVMEVVIMYDQEKKKSRGFGFLSFEDEDAVERCVADHFVNLNGKQVEIKKAEPRDAAGKMNDNTNTWGAPQGGPQMGMGGGMGMGGPNGQMSGPIGGMSHMPPGNMMQSYQGWGTPPASTAYPGQWGPSPPNGPPVNASSLAGYGTPSGGYQQWGAPPGPQSQQMPPPQWGSNYASQQQSYGSYGPPQGPQSGYSNNWNWNMPQSSGGPGQGGPGPTQGGPQGDIYSRAASSAGPASGGPAPPGAGPTQKTPDYNYGSYGAYSQDSSSYGGPARSYGADATSTSGNGTPGYPTHAPVPAMSQTTKALEYRNARKKSRTISFKEYIEAELNNKPVFSTNQGKQSKDPVFENGTKELKCSPTSVEGSRSNSPPRYYTSQDYEGLYQVYPHEAPGPQRGGQPYNAAPPNPSYHPYRR